MVCRKTIATILVIALAILVSGCTDYGDTSTAIEKWNKVADKTQQIRLLDEQLAKTIEQDTITIEAELAKDAPNYNTVYPILDKWQNKLDEERKLLEEESSLISDFAGATVNLDGDAKRYADSALSSVRESHRYAMSSVDNLNRGIDNLRMNYRTSDEQYYRRYEQYMRAADTDVTSSGMYNDRANDAMKKLEALQ